MPKTKIIRVDLQSFRMEIPEDMDNEIEIIKLIKERIKEKAANNAIMVEDWEDTY